MDPNGRLRARLAADYERLEFLKVLRDYGTEKIDGLGSLLKRKGSPSSQSDFTDSSESMDEAFSE
jgi:rod shape-determining protein MreC